MITDDLAAIVSNAVFAARDAGEFALADDNIAVKLETPANKQFGDYSSNIALTLKKATGINNSRDIADRILQPSAADNQPDRPRGNRRAGLHELLPETRPGFRIRLSTSKRRIAVMARPIHAPARKF